MFCRHCGKEIDNAAVICVGCGVPVGKGKKYCPNCGEETAEEAVICVKCGVTLVPPAETVKKSAKSKLVAGLLGIFLGSYGVHNFYLGFTKKAVIQIIVTCVTCGIGGLWGFIEGIMIICGKNAVDANGAPLDD